MGQKKRNQLSRRGLLVGAVAIGGAGVASTVGSGSAVAAPGAGAPQPTAFGPVTVRAGDLRYENLVRGNNFRFVGRPDEIRVVGSTDQVVRAVSDAVRSSRRVAVRSGGRGRRRVDSVRRGRESQMRRESFPNESLPVLQKVAKLEYGDREMSYWSHPRPGVAPWKWRERWELNEALLKKQEPEVYDSYKQLSPTRVFRLE